MNNIRRILVIKPSSLGDVLHTFPAVSILAEKWPEATIDWLINPEFSGLVEFHKNVSNPVIFNRKKIGKPLHFFSELGALRKSLRENPYDLVVDFQGLLRSGLVAKLTGCKRIYGFNTPKEPIATWFYTNKIEIPETAVHAVEKNIALACAVTGTEYRVPASAMARIDSYYTSLKAKLDGESINENDMLIGIVPGARWDSKIWPPIFFVESIKSIMKIHPNAKFVVVGAGGDKERAAQIVAGADSKNVVSMAGRTSINELVELLRMCNVVITNDSGPMHIAAALDVPTIALFGPTDPNKTGPFGDIHTVLSATQLECLTCLKRTCPNGTLQCHTGIDSSKVADIVTAMKNNEGEE